MEGAQKAHIDLELVKGVVLQEVQRGVPAAEIVHPYLIARGVEALDGPVHHQLVLGEDALGDLDAQVVVGDAELLCHFVHHGVHVEKLEIPPGEVHGNGQRGSALVDGLPQLGADITDDEGVQTVDEVVALQHMDELVRHDHPELRVDPPRQGLKAADLPGDGADDGLVVDPDMGIAERGVKGVQNKTFGYFRHAVLLSRA